MGLRLILSIKANQLRRARITADSEPFHIRDVSALQIGEAEGAGVHKLGQSPPSCPSKTASLSSFEERSAIFLLALISICSPVAGLRPMRAARLRT